MSKESPTNQPPDYDIPCTLLPALELDMSESIPPAQRASVPVGGFVRDEKVHEITELDSAQVGRRLFAVAEAFRPALRADTVIVATDCPERSAPTVLVGQCLEFRNPTGSVRRGVVSGIMFVDPPNPDRPFAFPIQPDPPGSPVEIGAEVWSLPVDAR
jgi:hypothetical protein